MPIIMAAKEQKAILAHSRLPFLRIIWTKKAITPVIQVIKPAAVITMANPFCAALPLVKKRDWVEMTRITRSMGNIHGRMRNNSALKERLAAGIFALVNSQPHFKQNLDSEGTSEPQAGHFRSTKLCLIGASTVHLHKMMLTGLVE